MRSKSLVSNRRVPKPCAECKGDRKKGVPFGSIYVQFWMYKASTYSREQSSVERIAKA
jgi:hypothetical protein